MNLNKKQKRAVKIIKKYGNGAGLIALVFPKETKLDWKKLQEAFD